MKEIALCLFICCFGHACAMSSGNPDAPEHTTDRIRSGKKVKDGDYKRIEKELSSRNLMGEEDSVLRSDSGTFTSPGVDTSEETSDQ